MCAHGACVGADIDAVATRAHTRLHAHARSAVHPRAHAPPTPPCTGHPVDNKAPVKYASALRYDEYSSGGASGLVLHRWKLHAIKRGKQLPAGVPAGWGGDNGADGEAASGARAAIEGPGGSARASHNYSVELYDVLADPGERMEISGQHPDTVSHLLAILEAAQADEAPQVQPDPRCGDATLLYDAAVGMDVLAPWCDTRQR